MADADTSADAANGGAPVAAPGGAAIEVLAQFVKDLSFENPNALAALRGLPGQPDMNVGVNCTVQTRGEDQYEVALSINASVRQAETAIYELELVYCGLVRLRGVSESDRAPILMIEVPRLLFPFARELVATTTRNGGFVPLMLNPIDFAALYRQRVNELMASKRDSAQA